ncbi:hypothetical protein PpBr36_08247 [Pyricularia pennisetigena]|uniref:hypothetical protein n=1 Tax=Pyricularia pennisetigena TaxID=1578925 RepID=UPI00114FB0C7|nr:hypothetical protein PpBr36_08247 [Pyricularia pennisetigena]TLS23929.1 hypothetical protein PpBr36_08247 [Pyricularia pennisetigena]
MPPLKRKHPHTEAGAGPHVQETEVPGSVAPQQQTRRVTRHTDAVAASAPPTVPPPSPSAIAQSPKAKRGRPPRQPQQQQPQPLAEPVAAFKNNSSGAVRRPGRGPSPLKGAKNIPISGVAIARSDATRTTRTSRHSNDSSLGAAHEKTSKGQSDVIAQPPPAMVVQPAPRASSNISSRLASSTLGQPASSPGQNTTVMAASTPIPATATSKQPPPSPAAFQSQQRLRPGAAPTPEKRGLRTDRNIDKVVLGNACFSTWYPSYHGKEILGDASGPAARVVSAATDATNEVGAGSGKGKNSAGKDGKGGKGKGQQARREPMIDRLYVCPYCFKYSKVLLQWWKHTEFCSRRNAIPGRKVYVHPKGSRTIPVPAPSKPGRKRKSDGAEKAAAQTIQDEGEWSIWEVDGEDEVLFCQNLSLFGKLFLDNKSVFFDVAAFNYYLLVYTPPSGDITGSNQEKGGISIPTFNYANTTTANNTTTTTTTTTTPRIVGFFSKEKLSWDNNTLACILIFPPWQRKGLGALLMGVSYEIARREGLLGGPEKPISDLGRKGYRRYWSGEIARWLLTKGHDKGSHHGHGADQDDHEAEVVVDIEECSRAIWVAAEDVLLTLREMDIAEDAGMGPPRARLSNTADGENACEDSSGQQHANENNQDVPNGEGHTKHAVKQVRRVRISKARVREWVAANRIDLTRPCDPEGFIGAEGRPSVKPTAEHNDDMSASA